MEKVLSKSKFKPHVLKFFRQVQETGQPLIITDHSKPVLKIIPYTDDPLDGLNTLRGSVIQYEGPTDPVGLEDWEAFK